MGKLFLLFALLPFAELYVLFQIGHALGGVTPVLMVVGSGLLGVYLARSQGLRMFEAWRAAMAGGTLPSASVVDGVLVLLGCVLLILPGVISDALGLLLLVPMLRRPIGRWLMRRVERAIQRGTVHVAQHPGRSAAQRASTAEPNVIDVEGEEILPNATPKQLK